MSKKERWMLVDAAEECGLSQDSMLRFIALDWIHPADPDLNELDQEDIARARLIAELQGDFGVNDEAIPIILHLLDQIHSIRHELRLH